MAGGKQKQQQQKHKGGSKAAAGGSAKQQQAKPARRKQQTHALDDVFDTLERELALLGLRKKDTTADGNCLFRALSDQLCGDESQHAELRARVCKHMEARAEDFAPFVEDDASLDQHLARMRRPGCWGGHLELQAASLELQANVAVYQAGQPRWVINNFPEGARMLHLAYTGGEHYDSVRLADDYTQGEPPQPIGALRPAVNAAAVRAGWSAADEARVAAGTGCDSLALIRQRLQAAGGDVDAAIEAVIEVLAAAAADEAAEPAAEPADAAAAAASSSDPAGSELAAGQQQAVEPAGEPPAEHQQQEQPASAGAAAAPLPAAAVAEGGAEPVAAAPEQAPSSHASASSRRSSKGVRLKAGDNKLAAAKPVGRNKPCPCGSGRKVKACCGGAKKAPTAPRTDEGGLPVQLASLAI